MDRLGLTTSAEIPMNSPVLKMREFEFQVAVLHRENDELRLLLDVKNQEIAKLIAEKSQFEQEQEDAERRYMELEDKLLELEKQLKDRRGVITSSQPAPSSTSSSSATPITISAYSSPSTASMNLSSSQSIGRPLGLSSSQTISNSNSPNPFSSSSSSGLAASSSVVPSMASSSSSISKGAKPPASPTLTSCQFGLADSSHLEVSVVPSPTPAKKSRKKSLASIFSI